MIKQFRKQWLRWHKAYEKKSLSVFQQTFKTIANGIPWQSMTDNTYQATIALNVSNELIQQAYFDVYRTIGEVHGKRVGQNINKQINQKNFTLDSFLSVFERVIIDWVVNNAGQRITTVRESYIKFLTEIVARGISEGKPISQIATEMQKTIKSRKFYRWQAFRIARTETTAAANFAATVAGDTSGVQMDKVWVSAIDSRTRRRPEDQFDHYEMNGKKVPLDEAFDVNGEKMMYPGDPNGSAANNINCRCTVGQVVRRDSDGNIVFT